MRIPNWKVVRALSAAVVSPVVAVVMAILATANVGPLVVAQEATAEVKSDANANPEASTNAEVTFSGENPSTEPAAAVPEASEETSSSETANTDDSRVVPAVGGSTEGGSASNQSTIALASLAMVHSHSLAMTAIHNNYRSQAGLATQAVDPNLSHVAQNWANHMASVGSMYHGGGEQIIAYSGGDLSYEAGFRLWLNSSPHRAWLYSRGDRCGFGYAIGRNGCAYFAGAFGSSHNSVSSGSYSGGYQSASNSGRRFRIFRRRS